ncbi:MAG: (2Fe-2S)-binding protein [Ignavibacteria bacterium]|nr:(2Fe-2S)-binding protein [Ignavibacteria bacterium]
MKKHIKFLLNGREMACEVEQNKRLLDFLREDLQLTGTKEGCSVGECGACTIIVDKLAVNSCLMLAVQVDGAEVMTVEGLMENGELSKMQQQFIDKGAIQCGFCTPGMMMSAYALIMHNPDPSVEEIKTAIAGNLCRCTGYKQIIEAVSCSCGK